MHWVKEGVQSKSKKVSYEVIPVVHLEDANSLDQVTAVHTEKEGQTADLCLPMNWI